MKKTLIGIGILIIFVATVSVIKRGSEQAGESVSKATLTVLTADVYVKPAGGDTFKKVKETAELTAGAEVKTSDTGRASISYPNDTTTTLDSDSYIKISVLDANGQKSRIELIMGSVWAKVKNVLATDDFYEVNTENTVASVRGTIFGVSHRNGITDTYGVESKIRVRLRDKTTGQPIDSTAIDITSNEKVSVDKKSAEARLAIAKKIFENDDYVRPGMKKMIERTMEEEDLRDEKVKTFMRKVIERNDKDKEFIEKLRERRLNILNGTTTPKVSPSRTPTPSETPKTSPTETPKTSESPTQTQSATPTPSQSTIPGAIVSPTPTSTLDTSPILESVVPKSVIAGNEFALNGRYFMVGRDIKQIIGVTVGGISAQFRILDSLTIFVIPPANLQPGIYDVGATTNSGSILLLKQAITIQ